MRKLLYAAAVTGLMLAGCGAEEAADSPEKSTEKKKSKGETAGFEEVASFELEGHVSSMNFQLDEDGDTLFWGEQNSDFSEEDRRHVRVGEEVQSLDSKMVDQFSFLTDSGIIVNGVTDWDAPEGEQHWIVELDPKSGDSQKFIPAGDRDDILHPSPGTYLLEPKTYIHTDTEPDDEQKDQTYLWDVETQEITQLDFLEKMIKEAGEIKYNPHYNLNDDGTKVYAIIWNAGVFSYDLKSGETETLMRSDKVYPGTSNNENLTANEDYVIYGVQDEEAELMKTEFHALNLETKETMKLGSGGNLFTLKDGNAVIIDENKLMTYDFEKEELSDLHTIIVDDNQKLDNVTVSSDGSTIAYGMTTTPEDGEKQYEMKIVSK
ncbi:hypothetical protein AAEO50_02155 [Rossellomorea oryzaecorticis]|uniref:Uncharacterized protein n=1 Tax=Rossellomorea oryzaecorticis TaxID=1396505 RepID=A0ABU9K4Y3_9BACI